MDCVLTRMGGAAAWNGGQKMIHWRNPDARADCRKAEPADDDPLRCRWCGRPCTRTARGTLAHRRGYKRVHADPRLGRTPPPPKQ